MITSVSSTVLALLIGVPAAYALSRGGFKSSRRIALWILATRMAPPIAFTIPFFLAYRYLGLSDTLVGPHHRLSDLQPGAGHLDDAAVLRQRAARAGRGGLDRRLRRMGSLPPRDAAAVGAGPGCDRGDLLHPVVERLLLRAGADAHEASTAPVAIVNFIQYTGWEWGRIAAAGTLVMLPVVIFSILVRNYLVRGLAAGGVKE